jgi:pimeloyl-ACP methyl ester carboxylesterase
LSLEKSPKENAARMIHKAKYGVDKFILVQKYKIHYVEAGAGEPIILIPGSYNTYRAWNRLMPLLAEDFRLLALDYVGPGDSDKPGKGFEHTIQEQTDLIVKMVQQMGLDKVSLIGSSYGGAIVFDFAARHPDLVSKIVSIEGGVIRPEKTRSDPMEYCLKFPVIGDLFVKVARTGDSRQPVDKQEAGKWYFDMTEEDQKDAIEQGSSNAKSASRVPWYKISLTRKTSLGIEEAAKYIRLPILYIYGTKSDFKKILLDKNIEYLKNFLPHAWIVALEGGIPDLVMQRPEEVASLILDFLHKRPSMRNLDLE